ncbi:MAG: nicotinamide-nucleotide amidohydrolase family protein, partial [Myxococcota bacterium]
RPDGAEVIHNPRGTAPGFSLTVGGCRFVSVPGVPREFDGMIESVVLVPLRERATPREKRTLRCFGIPEAEVDSRLAGLATEFPMVRQGYRAHFPEIHVTLRAERAHVAQLDEVYSRATELLAKETYTLSDDGYAEVVLETLRAKGFRLALAESCTGGHIGDMLTDVPGSSDVLWGGTVAYDNAAKLDVLNVNREDLERDGAVSEVVVRQMADGARRLSGCECAVAVSGIAGPNGGTDDKPVGTVWMAAATPDEVKARVLRFPFERRRNKIVSAYSALELLRRMLK